jgi:internalin A
LAARWDEDRVGESAEFRHAFLHGGLIRSILAEIGEIAGIDALYWQGGLCVFEAETKSRVLIEQEMTGRWQGVIRVRTQGGQVAAALGKFVELIEDVQARLGMVPTNAPLRRHSTLSGASAMAQAGTFEPSRRDAIVTGQEKPDRPEWLVSYAWGDDRTPEGRERDQVVDRLCDAAETRGRKILRDKKVLGLGDVISAFMKRIGRGDRIFVILSEKYLRSPYCMFELSEIWRNSKQEGEEFRKRVRVYALPDATIWQPLDWVRWAAHWKQEYDLLDHAAREHGPATLGQHGFSRLTDMQHFYTQVSDILGTLANIVQPRSWEELERYGFDDPPALT